MKNKKSDEIKKALEEVLSSPDSKIEVEKILQTLDDKKILRYHRDGDINLLSTSGRVLISLLDDPTMTVRALSVYLGLSETMVDKTLKSLISNGMVSKTKVNRQNVYKLNKSLIMEQVDIQKFLTAIGKMQNEKPNTQVDEQELF